MKIKKEIKNVSRERERKRTIGRETTEQKESLTRERKEVRENKIKNFTWFCFIIFSHPKINSNSSW